MNISNNTYEELKIYYDHILNKDKSTYKSTNDEPTPTECIETMFSKLPNTFYQNTNIKVLDPCCGNGNFHLILRNLLLAHGFNDTDILENIMYFNDINIDRTNNVKTIFGDNSLVSNHDFLDYQYNTKFDLIVANPPYAKLMTNGKRASKNHNLVKLFIKKSLELLHDGGFLIYIVPDNWMSLSDRNTLLREMTQFQFHWLDIHSAKKWFPKIGSSFTWFVLEKTPFYKPFTVQTLYKKELYTSSVISEIRDYIPLIYTDKVQNIFKKTIDANNEKFTVETSSDLHKFTKKELISTTQSDEFQYKLIHTPKQTVYAKRPHKFQNGYKVFISTTDTYKVFVDNCGMTQSIVFIRCQNKTQADSFKTVLEHDLYKFINNICRWGNFNNIRILQKFPKCTNVQNIYNQFNITADEIKFIESII
jgi:methylase of polypeptide subunit release factors